MTKKLKLTSKQEKFLCAINSQRDKGISINNLGRLYFKTDRSVYLVVNLFADKGLVILEADKKKLIVTTTKKGKDYINENI